MSDIEVPVPVEVAGMVEEYVSSELRDAAQYENSEPLDDGKGHDLDVVLTFCPSCAAEVKRQDAWRLAEASR